MKLVVTVRAELLRAWTWAQPILSVTTHPLNRRLPVTSERAPHADSALGLVRSRWMRSDAIRRIRPSPGGSCRFPCRPNNASPPQLAVWRVPGHAPYDL